MDVNQKELAAILGITDRRVRQLKNEFGLFSKGLSSEKKQKNYVLEKCVPEYINYKLEAEVQQGTGYNKEKEHHRYWKRWTRKRTRTKASKGVKEFVIV